jgi:hypothetical protein
MILLVNDAYAILNNAHASVMYTRIYTCHLLQVNYRIFNQHKAVTRQLHDFLTAGSQQSSI